MSIAATGAWPAAAPTPPTFTAGAMVSLYALMGSASGAASPVLISDLQSAARVTDADDAMPTGAPATPSGPGAPAAPAAPSRTGSGQPGRLSIYA